MSTGTWAVTEPQDSQGHVVPVAASGGWTDDGTLRVAVLFLETPHRLDVTLTPAGGRRRRLATPAARRDRLGELRCP